MHEDSYSPLKGSRARCHSEPHAHAPYEATTMP